VTLPLHMPNGLPAPEPVALLRDQAEAAAACSAGPLSDVPATLADQLRAWIWSAEQDNLTMDQRREIDRIPTLLLVLAARMEGQR
jgi:hypothetical protein